MKKQMSFLVGMMLVMVFFIIMPINVSAATITVDDDGGADYTTIQAAIFAATSGDTIIVQPGIYEESLSIDQGKNLNIIGQPGAIIKCPATPRDIKFVESSHYFEHTVLIAGGTYSAGDDEMSGPGVINVNFEGFTIDSNDYPPSAGHSRFASILCRNIHGSIKNCNIINTNVDGQETFGILCYGDMDIEIKDTTIDQFGRGGIGVNSGTCEIIGNTVIGPGPDEDVTWAPNGIQVGYGTTGTVEDNDVSGCGWPGEDWKGTGILIVDTDSVVVKNNYVHNNEQAIGAVDFPSAYGPPFDEMGISNIDILYNIVQNNEWGIEISNDASNINVKYNKIYNCGSDGIDVYCYDIATTDEVPTGIVINCNEIDGSGLDGLWVGDCVLEQVNAINNYWGNPSGPSGDGPGSGDTVIGNAMYDPWGETPEPCCTDAECGWILSNPAFKTNNGAIANIGTTATVGSGGTGGGGTTDENAPIIKCKWEYDLEVVIDVEDCTDCSYYTEGCYSPNTWEMDACPCLEYLQVKPDLGSEVDVGYYAVVKDPNGPLDIQNVYADVWHPDGEFKYQVVMKPLGFPPEQDGTPENPYNMDDYDDVPALAAWDKAHDCHYDLIAVNEDWALTLPIGTDAMDDIRDELDQEEALVYYGEAPISYCQPGGWYSVGVIAYDTANHDSAYLYNRFWYIPVAAVKIDFTTVDYGSIEVGVQNQCGGDDDESTDDQPTVRNIGNSRVNLYVEQDDMDFGTDTDGTPNVQYEARMGIDGNWVSYDPDTEVKIPGVLELCSLDKLDFRILADKGTNTHTYTGSMLLKACIHMNSFIWDTPDDHVGNAPGGVAQTFVYTP